jgi:hypothetical protein
MYVYLHLSLIDLFKCTHLDVPHHRARLSIFSAVGELS